MTPKLKTRHNRILKDLKRQSQTLDTEIAGVFFNHTYLDDSKKLHKEINKKINKRNWNCEQK